MTDTSHARKAEKTAYLTGAQFPGKNSARKLCPLAIRNVYDSKVRNLWQASIFPFPIKIRPDNKK